MHVSTFQLYAACSTATKIGHMQAYDEHKTTKQSVQN